MPIRKNTTNFSTKKARFLMLSDLGKKVWVLFLFLYFWNMMPQFTQIPSTNYKLLVFSYTGNFVRNNARIL